MTVVPGAAADAVTMTSVTRADAASVRPPLLVSCFAVAVFVLGTGAFLALQSSDSNEPTRPLVLLLWVLAYAFAGAVLLDGVLRHRARVPLPTLLVAVVALTALSVLWSEAPLLTLRRSVGLAGTVVVGLLIAQRLTPLDVLAAVRRAMLVIAVASLLLFVLGDARVIDPIHGTLRGVVGTKNSLGSFMALGILAALTTAFLHRAHARRHVLAAVVMAAALAFTDSTAATATALLVILGAMGAAMRARPVGRLALGGCLALALAGTAVLLPLSDPDTLAGAIGEDTTLTGRDAVWDESLRAAAERPVLGYGYGAFWEGSGAADDIRARLQWPVPNGHNGLLDVALDLGLVGAALMVLLVLALLVRGAYDAARGSQDAAVLRLSVGALLILRNTVESGLLQQNTLLTVLLVVALAIPAHTEAPTRPGDRPAVDA
jgi:O-antigen ligase